MCVEIECVCEWNTISRMSHLILFPHSGQRVSQWISGTHTLEVAGMSRSYVSKRNLSLLGTWPEHLAGIHWPSTAFTLLWYCLGSWWYEALRDKGVIWGQKLWLPFPLIIRRSGESVWYHLYMWSPLCVQIVAMVALFFSLLVCRHSSCWLGVRRSWAIPKLLRNAARLSKFHRCALALSLSCT